jgi:hypothetical protein
MKMTTGPHQSREEHLQGLLERKRFLCAESQPGSSAGPATVRSRPSTDRSTTSWTTGGSGGPRTLPGDNLVIPSASIGEMIIPLERPLALSRFPSGDRSSWLAAVTVLRTIVRGGRAGLLSVPPEGGWPLVVQDSQGQDGQGEADAGGDR